MKKLFVFVLTMVVMTISAQDKVTELKPVRYEADPMTNPVGCTVWENEYIKFIEDDNGEVNIELQNPPHVFDVCAKYPKVGFYDLNNKLIAMSERVASLANSSNNRLLIVNAWSKDSILPHCEYVPNQRLYHYNTDAKNILKFLKNHEGYIRIVVCLYGDYLFDIKRIAFAK